MSPAQRPGPLVLCILDGWGLAAAGPDNAILSARTPIWRSMLQDCAATSLETSGEAVGLPCGQMGNSEVGHLTMGAGRIFMQDLPRIDHAVSDGSIADCPAFQNLVADLKQSGGRCHLMGLLSPGGVHSHENHMAALANLLANEGIAVLVHAFLDGRDTPPSSARDDMARFVAASPQATVATVTGRYYAMDRDNRWERVERAYDAIVAARGTSTAPHADAAITNAYGAGQTDEFVKPVVIDGYDGMKAGDGLLMANFRADRARQILNALLDPGFSGFSRSRVPDFAAVAGMVSYSAALDPFLPCLFQPQHVSKSLGSLVADAGLIQLRIAETEKYAHVTYFFNGGGETVFAGEERVLVPSPRVATYDLQPEMSAGKVTDKLVAAIKDHHFDLVICNFANPDMVGHTGIFAAALKAVETVDQCLGRIADAVADAGGYLVVTADHGNIESMRDPITGEAHTAHTTNPVPLVIVNAPVERALRAGGLADLAPTLLDLLKLPQPDEMTGQSLLSSREQ
ncbi:MAG: 2,3-bisphosphoglycerate-independent phosphoglycerate mutase [Rhodospirillaceae bacterium]|jgi:2,3-bisphosphoglycerate-independent phosphoglycerate mutase|nr:2,3-bisphosphoglycerate-independent phosphoglycerate mutase [Rhodospirillaceae bacterium]MBT6512730.1 2,3-bisphosphoglycerate-independent phosphoglycerate mutase [Rhodospirillaceae bacterium]MBT7648915.1 2,3-bisphosphoglycerate-independent phosphoglycerate mutase [Rhodospirillaceae bacterium]